ncbi:MAG: CopG family transcriptional regulator [Christensenellaceae bacterium]
MNQEEKMIELSRKDEKRGEDKTRVVSLRMREELVQRLDALSQQTNRSRNDIVNFLVQYGVEHLKIVDR